MKTLLGHVHTIPMNLIPAISLIMIVFVGYLDHISGFELTFSIFFNFTSLQRSYII